MNTQLEATRRDFLKAATVAAGAVVVRPAFAADEKDPYAGFKMGIQSYSLREFDEAGALERTGTLGLKYWESFPGHIPLSVVPKHIAEQKETLAKAGVTVLSYGVVPFDANESKSRELFEFAKGMGLKALSADPEKNKETFDLLDKLVEEYGVAIAIHNHGPGHRYDKIDDVWEMIKDRHPKVGACVDTGHYLRSDEDPVAAIRKFGKKVFSVHLKDVKTIESGGKRDKIFTIIGEGDLNILGCLKALREHKYDHILAIEYEENPENPLSDIEVGLKNVRAAAAKMG